MRGRLGVALVTIVSFFTLSASARASADEFPSPVDRIFIPSAFDADDEVEIVLHGNYPNSCYRSAQTGAEVNEETKTITVWATSTLSGEMFCYQSFVSFLQVVKVGVLEGGRYTVVYRDGEARTELDVRGKDCDARQSEP